jgi:hypothetical protein
LNHASSAQPKRATKIGSISLEGLAQFYANAPTVPCFYYTTHTQLKHLNSFVKKKRVRVC